MILHHSADWRTGDTVFTQSALILEHVVQMIIVHENGFTEIKSSGDTDEMPPFHFVASQLGLHCLLKSNLSRILTLNGFQTGYSIFDKASLIFKVYWLIFL